MEIWKKWEPLLSLPAWKSRTQPLNEHKFYKQHPFFCREEEFTIEQENQVADMHAENQLRLVIDPEYNDTKPRNDGCVFYDNDCT